MQISIIFIMNLFFRFLSDVYIIQINIGCLHKYLQYIALSERLTTATDSIFFDQV
jgi:hypothetical protein